MVRRERRRHSRPISPRGALGMVNTTWRWATSSNTSSTSHSVKSADRLAVPAGRSPTAGSGRARPHGGRPRQGGWWSRQPVSALRSRLATPPESRLATCLARLAPSPRIRSHLVAAKGFTGRVGREALNRSDSMREAAIRCKGVHRAARRSGVPDRIRTDDIQLGKLTLYQLSYGHARNAGRKVERGPGGVKWGRTAQAGRNGPGPIPLQAAARTGGPERPSP